MMAKKPSLLPSRGAFRELMRDPFQIAILSLARSLHNTYEQLIPKGRDRGMLLFLVALGAFIPVTELFVTKLFTDVITKERNGAGLKLIVGELLIFFFLFLLTRVAHYAQRIYRVQFFDTVFRKTGRQATGGKASWEWALGLELVNVLSFATQLAVMAAFFVWLAPVYGAFNILLILLLTEVVARLFKAQMVQQKRYHEQRFSKNQVSAYQKLPLAHHERRGRHPDLVGRCRDPPRRADRHERERPREHLHHRGAVPRRTPPERHVRQPVGRRHALRASSGQRRDQGQAARRR